MPLPPSTSSEILPEFSCKFVFNPAEFLSSILLPIQEMRDIYIINDNENETAVDHDEPSLEAETSLDKPNQVLFFIIISFNIFSDC